MAAFEVDNNNKVAAANMRPFNNRGAVAGSTSYDLWDTLFYRGRRILVTNPFTTGAGTNPFISAANYTPLAASKSIDASEWGVVGDGSTDNYTALQAACDYAADLGGGKVVLPYGFIMISATIELKTAVWLEGQGPFGTVLKLTTDANCDVIKFHESTNGTSDPNAFWVGISNLRIDGNKDNQSGAGPYYGIRHETNPFNTAASGDPYFDTSHIIQNVWIYKTKGDGYFSDGRSDIRLEFVKASFCDGNSFTSSFDTHFVGCVSENAGLAGFYSQYSSIQFTNCKAYKSGQVTAASGHGFFIESGKEVTITGCDAQQNKGDSFRTENNEGVIFSGCTSSEAGYTNGSGYYGYNVDGTTSSIVQGTHVSTSSGTANALNLVNSSADNMITLSHYQSSGSIDAISSGSSLTNNTVFINGHNETNYLSNVSLFGDGSDGSATLDGTATVSWASKSSSTYTMTSDCFVTDLTIESGVTLKPNGHKIYSTGLVANHGTLQADGNNASTNNGASATGAGSLGGGAAGGGGQIGNGSNGSVGGVGVGNGGAGGAGATGSGGTQGFSKTTATWPMRNAIAFSSGALCSFGGLIAINGGAGGGGGGGDGTNRGGGGGSGGGLTVVFAHFFENDGTMTAIGGNGFTPTTGNAGGGGGAGGGGIAIFTLAAMSDTGTTLLTGGTGGSGVGTGANGNNGSSGSKLNVIVK